MARSRFREAAIASRLLTPEQMAEALAAIGAEIPNLPAGLVDVTDDALADKLIVKGWLNRWQAEQLKKGLTKFTLKDYQIIDSLGQGGMGQVFKAEHSIMGRVVAIKVLPRSRSTPEAIASFHHEIRVLAQLDHPNLVRAYDAGQDGNVHFLVTEFVPGNDLRRLVREKGALDQRSAATIISQAALGLQHAHGRGLLHRDVKPGNVMVTPDGVAKVLDLGLAGFLQEAELAHEDPRKGRIVGTADYLSPEQIMTPSKVSPSSDVYGLGCTLYYAVTKKVPFPGGTTAEKCQRHLREMPINPRRFSEDLTEPFLDVLAAMMEKEPEKRIASATEVVRRLAPWVDQRVAAAMPHVEPRFARAAPAPARPGDAAGADLRALLEVAGEATDGSSQGSQGTEGVQASNQETLPIDGPRPAPPRSRPEVTVNEVSGPIWSRFPIGLVILVVAVPALLLILLVILGLVRLFS